jgi:serpin B
VRIVGLLLLAFALVSDFAGAAVPGTGAESIATAVNALGVDLYRAQAARSDGNLLLSPYSIQTALAMVYAGADGETKVEMERVLHLAGADEVVADGFASFGRQLVAMTEESKRRVALAKTRGGPSTPVEVTVANRLFVQAAYPLRRPFISLLADRYRSPLEQLDFYNAPEKSRTAINHWVEEQTGRMIRDLIPSNGVLSDTRVVLANAIYLHAPWEYEFHDKATRLEPFYVKGKESADVPTMIQTATYGYWVQVEFMAIQVPYAGGALSLLILLPTTLNGLADLEKKLTNDLLAKLAKIPRCEVILHLPKFRIEPPTVPLGSVLQQLGMKTAFDRPRGSANFDRMAQRKPDEYLYLSEVFHKAYLALDEKGTEAAAATAVAVAAAPAAVAREAPPVVRVDHPFVFAIQHVASGTCLFLGRVIDPR